MKKYIVPLMAVLAVILIFAGCTPGADTPDTPSTPAPETPSNPSTPSTPDTPDTPDLPGMDNPFEGLGVKPDGSPYHFAFSFVGEVNDYPIFCKRLWESYMERAGAESSVLDAVMDVNTQVSQLEDTLGRSPDAVLIYPLDGQAVGPVVDRYGDAGIPVFNEEGTIPSEAVVTQVTHDMHLMGETAGKFAIETAKKIDKQLTVYVLYGDLRMGEVAITRGQGFLDAVADSEWVTAVEGPDCGFTDAPAADAVISTFPANPELNGVYEMGCMAFGAAEGLRTIEKLYPVGDPNHIFFVGNDEFQPVCELIEDGWVDGVVSHSPYKELTTCVKVMFTNVILGEEVPDKIIIPSVIVSSDDVGTEVWDLTWGNIMRRGTPFDELPVGDWGIFPTPTKN